MPENENIEEEKAKDEIPKSEEGNETISPEQTIEQPETQNSQLQTENMEVHKHPHHVMHKKKWTEYLLEFLMIFFAVTMGFFAENIREHYTEENSAREYAQLLKQLQEIRLCKFHGLMLIGLIHFLIKITR
jgi:hypothetical protein